MLNPETIESIVQAAAQRLRSHYVFPDRGQEIALGLEKCHQEGRFANPSGPSELAEQITAALYELSKDKHLRLRHHPQGVSDVNTELPSEEAIRWWREEERLRNFGFSRLERLKGNIGYLELLSFSPAYFGAETAVAAMQFLGNTDAVIIDLRKNGGGDPEMIQMVTTYFFDEVTHLNSFYHRPQDHTTQTWTLPYVPGKRLLKQPLYVLTSNHTFSAAEEFTYNLKNLNRATIVGEVTGGGAHPGGHVKIHDFYTVFVPTGRAINPISGTNWEGTGVEPDVQVPAAEAFEWAYQDALQKVLSQLPEHQAYARQRQEIQEALKTPIPQE